jgi:hypothetical protein
MQQLENTDLLSDETDLMRYWNETSHGMSEGSDLTAYKSPLKTRQLCDSMVGTAMNPEKRGALSRANDMVPFKETLDSNNIQLQQMSEDNNLRLSALEADNRSKDQMIEILCQQINGLKACLEELLESDRLCENEYKIKWIEAEEKCRLLLNERDALLDETLKLATMSTHSPNVET